LTHQSKRNGEKLILSEEGNDSKPKPSIEAKRVSLVYGDGTKAVNDVSLTVPRGEFFGFLGPNGAGKTTFIKILTTLLKPTRGEARVNGFSVGEDPQAIRESIGYMAQETNVDKDLTAEENVRFACEAYGVPRGVREERIRNLLELVGLYEVADKRVKEFSGGMKKRLDAATALVHEPPLIFLDEPTTGLDPKSRKKLWKYFEKINDRGRTIFLTTQYLEEADYLCDRVGVIQGGKIVELGSPEELKKKVGSHVLEINLKGDKKSGKNAAEIVRKSGILDDRATVETTEEGLNIGSDRTRELGTDILVKLRDEGFQITGFNLHDPTLDDVFLAITGERIDEGGREEPSLNFER